MQRMRRKKKMRKRRRWRSDAVNREMKINRKRRPLTSALVPLLVKTPAMEGRRVGLKWKTLH